MHKRVLDIEFIGIIEDGDKLVIFRGSVLGGHSVAVLCDFSHVEEGFVGGGESKNLSGGRSRLGKVQRSPDKWKVRD